VRKAHPLRAGRMLRRLDRRTPLLKPPSIFKDPDLRQRVAQLMT
jgi:hypothetical protein